MNKPYNLVKGDKVAIVSLSRGLLGMPFCKHELDLGIKRLKEYGLEPVMMDNTLKDMDYLAIHPEARASDLKEAFSDKSIKGIICAIGGNDTYRLIPYLMDDEKFKESVKNNPKIFIGFSDSTINHLVLNKLGLRTFYGPCFMADIAELDKQMLPYTKKYFDKLFLNEECFEIKSSDIWYSDREQYSSDQLGVPRKSHQEIHGYEVLNGKGKITGKLYGGCIESLYNTMVNKRHNDEVNIIEKYKILPPLKEWQDKILFLETSEEKPTPKEIEKMLLEFKNRGILDSVKGIIIGKPIDEKYYEEYKEIYKKVFLNLKTPVLYNVNFGHSVPRCLLPYGAEATVNYDQKTITINEPILEKREEN